MQKLGAFFFFSFVFAVTAHAQWQVVSTKSEFAADRRIEHRRVEVRSENGTEAALDLALFSSKTATLRVIDDPQISERLAETMKRENCLAGVNGGYFDPEYLPVGLLVSDGRTIAPQRKARLLSGVVSVVKGRVRIQRTAEFSRKSKPTAALQCGPFLVDHAQAIAGLNDTRAARRTFVATGSADQSLVGYATHLTLAQLAAVLATPAIAHEMKLQRALNLDGGSSSAFWCAQDNGAFSIREQKSVRNYLAVVPVPAPAP
ncbi:MAG TPA: phosphodiester glycosidase family protein [Chthoniobacterales bacterium]|nr:phosphodiester glycosidase family protein [Chthoniobacterales bacterium]